MDLDTGCIQATSICEFYNVLLDIYKVVENKNDYKTLQKFISFIKYNAQHDVLANILDNLTI